MTDASARTFPRLIAFDIDYTLWNLWIDTHVTPPLKRRSTSLNQIYDARGTPLSFYPDVPSILLELHHAKVHVAAASRTSAPGAAREALKELLVPGWHREEEQGREGGVSAIRLFDTLEIYPGSKLAHFKEIHEKTRIPYEEMVFYDDEPRNREVTKLGVTFVLVPDGVHRKVFEAGIETWRKKRESM